MRLKGKVALITGAGGSIINTSSIMALRGMPSADAYTAAKGGIISLTRSLAVGLGPRNIRVNVLCPGFFPAEQNRAVLDDSRVESIMHGTPMARFGEPAELVGAALLLLSPVAGSFITGATFYVDGGFTSTSI